MNVFFINSMKADEFGGGEKWMISAALGLKQRGHNVLIGGKSNSRFIHAAEEKYLPIVALNIKTDFSPITSLKIAKMLKKNQIDIVICNFNKDVRVAGLAARLMRSGPQIIARHGIVLCPKKVKHRLTLTLLADGIITNTTSIKKIYDSYGWFKRDFVKVIYNGIEIPQNVKDLDLGSTYPGKKIIFAAGRLTTQKGFNYLIDTASLLKKKRSDLVFLIAGEGDQYKNLTNRIEKLNLENQVHLIGHINDVQNYISASQLVVLTSLHEGMPNIIMEAMAMGKPVIATDVNGVRELVESEITGLIIPPKDPNALMNAIESMIDNEEVLLKYGESGKRRIGKYFTLKSMIDRLENYLLDKLREQ